MRRLLSIVCFVMVFFVVLSVSVGALSLNNTWVEDGNTYAGEFRVRGTSYESDWLSIMNSPYNFVFSDGTDFIVGAFSSAPSGVYFPYDSVSFSFPADPSVIALEFVWDGEGYECVRRLTYGAGTMIHVYGSIVSGNYFASYGYPENLPDRFFADYEGYFGLRDDMDGGSSGNWWDWLLDWLSSFWDKLKSFFIGLFVPADGYFQSWFEDIKAAFESKMGGLSVLFSEISNAFNRLSTADVSDSKLIFTLPDNSLWSGFKGQSVDLLVSARSYASWVRLVLNGIILIFTVVVCYKKLIAIIKT